MKVFILIIVLLGSITAAPGQVPKSDSHRQSPDARSELHKLNQELIQSIKEYKVSLERLRTVYEQSLRRAEERLVEARTLYSQQKISKIDLDVRAQAVEDARQKVFGVTQRIAAADKRIELILLETTSVRPLELGSTARDIPTAVQQSEEHVSKVIATAEDHFRKGQLELEANKRTKARDEFDMAIDSILESGLDVRANFRLQAFYFDLVERIYQAEVPHDRRPAQIGALELVTQNRSSTTPPQTTGERPQIGFRQQTFEPSPLDELSMLVLTPDERTAANTSHIAPGHRISSPACNPTIIRGAQLRGFHLSMTASEVKARLPRLKSPVPDSSGFARVSVHFSKTHPPPAFLKGVLTMVFDFIDGRVSYIGVLYDDSIKWRSLDQFTKQVANSLSVPENWQPYTFKGEQQRMLHCGTLRFVAAMVNTGRIVAPGLFLVDDGGIEKLIVRKQQALERARKQAEMERQKKLREEEERRRTFKP